MGTSVLLKVEEIYRTARNALIPSGLWGLFYVRVEAGELRFGGFAIPPRALPMPLRFFVDGIEATLVTRVEKDPSTPLIAARFGLPGSSQQYEFHAVLPMERLGDAHTLRMEFRPGSGRELAPYQDWHVPLAIGLQADTARRVRVARTEDATMFEAMGLSAKCALSRALGEYFGRALADCGAILDWGCGCGRVARFVAEEAPDKLVGIDIDPDNIGWCAQNIPHAQFHPIGLNPPTSLPASSFDLVYGISVFTHLSEADQDLWLAELHRLTQPGAAVLMSIHGEIAFMRSDSDYDRFLDLQKRGFHVYGICDDLDEAVPEVKAKAYYKNVFHSRRYIYERWSRFFEVLDVIDAALGGHQDLVIMRRRP